MDIFQILPDLLKDIKEPVIFEVGARHGEDSQKMIDMFPSGIFYLFEPLPSNFDIILSNITGTQNCTVLKMALSDKSGLADFYVSSDPENFNGSSSLLAPKDHLSIFNHVKFNNKISVLTDTLDNVFRQVSYNRDRIDFIYADTQGAEAKIIQGGQEALKKTRYFYSEYYQNEMYAGQVPLETWEKMLPGRWELIHRWPNDALFKNLDYEGI